MSPAIRKLNPSSSLKKNQSNITSFTGKKSNTQKSPTRSGRGDGRLPKPTDPGGSNKTTISHPEHASSKNSFAPLANMEIDMESEDTSKTPITGNAKVQDNSTEHENVRIYYIYYQLGAMQQTDNAQRTANAPLYATARLPIPLTPYLLTATYM